MSIKKSERFLLQTYIALTYDCLYDDYATVDVHKLLKGIPSMCILNFIVNNFYKVEYALTDNTAQRRMIRDICNYVKGEPRKRIWKFLNDHPYTILIESYGLFMLNGLILQNWTPAEPNEDSLDLCEDEYEPVYKALLYCNQRWTDWQVKGMKNYNMTDISLLIDMPVVEFKLYKDFETQLYKAIKFFEFCENDSLYSTYLPYFYDDHKIECWKQYLLRLFAMMKASLNDPYVTIDNNYLEDRLFFDQYIVELRDCQNLWGANKALNYFRNHFLIKLSRQAYMLLNPNLLVDKFYQGMKFDFFNTLKNHSLTNAKGKVIDNYADFSSDIGTRFSEPILLYSLMNDVFADKVDAIYTGEQLKATGVQAEPDLYMRIGETLFLFEYKDVTLADDVKYSADAEKMKEAICKKLCKYENGKAKKGAGQLHYTMENIFLHGSFNTIDPDVKQVKRVFPVIMTTDRSFSALGVNLVVIEEYDKIRKAHPIGTPVFISVPIIMDMDIIIKCANRLNIGAFKLDEILMSYIVKNNYNLSPFNTYVIDNYLCKRPFDAENTNFLFGDFIEGLNENTNI